MKRYALLSLLLCAFTAPAFASSAVGNELAQDTRVVQQYQRVAADDSGRVVLRYQRTA